MTADDLADQAALREVARDRGGLGNEQPHPGDWTVDDVLAEIARLEAGEPDADPDPPKKGKKAKKATADDRAFAESFVENAAIYRALADR